MNHPEFKDEDTTTMNKGSISHTAWDYKCHIAWIPKYRKKNLLKDLRWYVGSLRMSRQLRRNVDSRSGI
jgi:REP element-mobilizing transposase RayT